MPSGPPHDCSGTLAQADLPPLAASLPSTCLPLVPRSPGGGSRTHRITSQPRWGLWTRRKRRKMPGRDTAKPGSHPGGSRCQVSTAETAAGTLGCCPRAPPQRSQRSAGRGGVGLGWGVPRDHPLIPGSPIRNGGNTPCLPTCCSRCWTAGPGAGTCVTATSTCTGSHHAPSSCRPLPSRALRQVRREWWWWASEAVSTPSSGGPMSFAVL